MDITPVHLSIDVVKIKRQLQKEREERETAKDLQGKAGNRVRKPRALPIFGINCHRRVRWWGSK